MSAGAMARRYAGALFDVVERSGQADRAGEELASVAALAGGHAELARVFASPAIPPARKRAVLEAVLAAGGGVSDEVGRMLLLLADRDRLALLPAVAAAFTERALQARRILPAEVVTAVPLDETQRAALADALGRAAACEVTLHARVDPAILGGVVARVGSLVFDGSVTRQLERLQARLAEAG